MAKVRVGIIGQGRSGRDIHAAWLKTDRRYKIVAITDRMKERRDRAEEELGCVAYKDYHELFAHDDIDVIINASPSHLHVPITKEILEAGFNCVTEKPLAEKAADVDMLIKTAKKNKVLFTVFQQSRFAPYFEQVKKVIDSGVLGRVVQINIAFNGFSRRYDWQTLQDHMGGNLLNTGPHPLDQALQLFGTDVMPDVACFMERAVNAGDAEDHVMLMLRGEGRPIVHLEISSVSVTPTPVYKVFGTHGGLEGSMTELNWQYFEPKENPKPRLHRSPLVDANGLPAYPAEHLKWIKRGWKVPKSKSNLFQAISKGYYSALYNTLIKGEELAIKPEEIRQQAAVIEECQRQNTHIYTKYAGKTSDKAKKTKKRK